MQRKKKAKAEYDLQLIANFLTFWFFPFFNSSCKSSCKIKLKQMKTHAAVSDSKDFSDEDSDHEEILCYCGSRDDDGFTVLKIAETQGSRCELTEIDGEWVSV